MDGAGVRKRSNEKKTSKGPSVSSDSTLPVKTKAQLLLQPKGNQAAFTKLIYATVCMLLLPVLTYFFTYYSVPSLLEVQWSENMKAVVAGVSAVAMVQTIIIGYIISAFRE